MFEGSPFFKEEYLEWMSIRNQQLTQRELLPGVNYGEVKTVQLNGPLEYMKDQMIVEINAHVLGKKLPSFTVTDTQFFNAPKNPWQHFKDMYADKWFMRWIVERWPIKFIKQKVELTATWDQWAAYPWAAQVPYSDNWRPVRIMVPARSKVTIEDFQDEA